MTTGTIYDNMIWLPSRTHYVQGRWVCGDEYVVGSVTKLPGGEFYWVHISDTATLTRGFEDTWEMAASYAMLGDTYVDMDLADDGMPGPDFIYGAVMYMDALDNPQD